MKPIALVGLPGCGKSTIGRHLAKRLALDFIDTDRVLEARLGRSIRDYFELEGEARFREHESAVLRDAVGRGAGVIATGGGIVLQEGNRRLLRESTCCIYVVATPESLAARLRNDRRRPLMQGVDPMQRIQELFADRDRLYREAAHEVFETRGAAMPVLVEQIAVVLAPKLNR